MASNWRPGHSSDEDDDDYLPVKSDTEFLHKHVNESQSAATLHSGSHVKKTQIDSRPPAKHVPDELCAVQKMKRSPSTDSIGEMLRHAGIEPEVADSRSIKWRQKPMIPNPNVPSGILVGGTKDLYLDDDFFVFRDSNGEPLRQPNCSKIEGPLSSGSKSKEEPTTLNVQSLNEGPYQNHTTDKEKKSTKGSKKKTPRKQWTQLPLDDVPLPKVCPYGPPEENRSVGRTRFK